jgi:hypothetical protein
VPRQIPEHSITVDTARFGRFSFQVGVDAESIETPFTKVPTAPMPVQTAYAVPMGIIFWATRSNAPLAAMQIPAMTRETEVL